MKKVFKKKILALGLMCSVLFQVNTIAFASSQEGDQELYENYQELLDLANEYNIPVHLSFDEYVKNYETCHEKCTYDEYEKQYVQLLRNMDVDEQSGGGDEYYYNTGTICPNEATYGKYSLLQNIKVGDVIYEANGGFGITGHIAIVEGIYSRADGGKYIRVIEAGSFGVARSILDDTRYDDKGVTVLRVRDASETQKNAAINFCISQLGKSYMIDFQKDTSANESDWYCSELVWASYKNQGIDIEVDSLGEPGVTPRDILNCSTEMSIVPIGRL